jgi:hypothetical protein
MHRGMLTSCAQSPVVTHARACARTGGPSGRMAAAGRGQTAAVHLAWHAAAHTSTGVCMPSAGAGGVPQVPRPPPASSTAFVHDDVEAGVAHRPPSLTSRYTLKPRLDTPSMRTCGAASLNKALPGMGGWRQRSARLGVVCMAHPKRVAKVQQQLKREISTMFVSDKASCLHLSPTTPQRARHRGFLRRRCTLGSTPPLTARPARHNVPHVPICRRPTRRRQTLTCDASTRQVVRKALYPRETKGADFALSLLASVTDLEVRERARAKAPWT